MKAWSRLVPAFGFSVVYVPQACGCHELKVLVGPLEAGVIEGRGCIFKNKPREPEPPGPLDESIEMLRRIGVPEDRIGEVASELPKVDALPAEERLPAARWVIGRALSDDKAQAAFARAQALFKPEETKPR